MTHLANVLNSQEEENLVDSITRFCKSKGPFFNLKSYLTGWTTFSRKKASGNSWEGKCTALFEDGNEQHCFSLALYYIMSFLGTIYEPSY